MWLPKLRATTRGIGPNLRHFPERTLGDPLSPAGRGLG
jgi:hypothetical protein